MCIVESHVTVMHLKRSFPKTGSLELQELLHSFGVSVSDLCSIGHPVLRGTCRYISACIMGNDHV